jgi:TRAP transporter TAXI family solute receptor
VVAILLLSVSEPEIKVEAPLPPQLYSSSYQLWGTGNRLGTYYPAGHILAGWLNNNLSNGEEVFKAVETNGSIDNIHLIEDNKLSFAFVESRIAKESIDQSASSSVRLVWPLWPDVVQFLKSPPNKNSDLEQLKSGFLGQKNSSTWHTSAEIFKASGIDPKNIEAWVQPEDVLAELANDRINFAMIQAGIPNRTVSDAVIFHNCSIHEFSDDEIEKFRNLIPTSQLVVIPAGYYGDNQNSIKTLGIPNVLVTNSKMSDETVKFVARLMSQASSALKMRHQAIADIPSKSKQAFKILSEIDVPIHPGALEFFEEQISELSQEQNE